MLNPSNFKIYLLLFFGVFSLHAIQAQNLTVSGSLGVGTNSPLVDFHIDENKIMLLGADLKGAGTKAMWLPSLHAFRAGEAKSDEWDTFNIGKHSVAFGENNKASGVYSFAVGLNNEASNDHAIGLGASSRATGKTSFAVGNNALASGMHAIAMGYFTEATGNESFAVGTSCSALAKGTVALGVNTTAHSYAEMVVGTHNTSYTPTSTGAWVFSDRVFVVGNGLNADNPSNALTVLKSGNVGIGTDTPNRMLEIATSTVKSPSLRLSAEVIDARPQIDLFYSSEEVSDWRIENDAGVFKIGRNLDLDGFLPESFITISAADGIRFNRNVRPYGNGIYNLGSDVNAWKNIYTQNGTVQISDAHEKKHIQDLQYGLQHLQQLRPVSFEWKNDVNQSGTKLGLIAQDVQKVLPEVVKSHGWVTDEKTGVRHLKKSERLGVYYSDLIPVLIKGIQEQQNQIETLQNQNTNLNQRLRKLEEQMTIVLQQNATQKTTISPSNTTPLEEKLLFQNEPNPFHQNTTIRYFIPSNVQKASLQISTSNGQLVWEQVIADRGTGALTIAAKQLKAGTYLYSLILEGKLVKTKRMILTK